jgi:hypothetical protein
MVISAEDGLKRIAQEPLAAELAHQTHLHAGELARSRDDIDAVNIGDNRVTGKRSTGQHVDKVDPE